MATIVIHLLSILLYVNKAIKTCMFYFWILKGVSEAYSKL